MGRQTISWTAVKAKEFKDYMRQHHLGAGRLAAALGVSRTTVWNWQRGENAPTESVQLMLRRLIDSKEPPPPPRTKTELALELAEMGDRIREIAEYLQNQANKLT